LSSFFIREYIIIILFPSCIRLSKKRKIIHYGKDVILKNVIYDNRENLIGYVYMYISKGKCTNHQ
jgi:hypothetical protein